MLPYAGVRFFTLIISKRFFTGEGGNGRWHEEQWEDLCSSGSMPGNFDWPLSLCCRPRQENKEMGEGYLMANVSSK